jgi:hypothetical protein
VVYVLQAAGYPWANNLDPQSCSPEDVLEFLTWAEGLLAHPHRSAA